MYQSQFGLSRRPFSSTPDPTCVVPVGGMPEAISELERCASGGQGIGLLTAPAGLGKTILCRKLADELRSQFAVVFLANANFPTRRSLLQAILYEMGHPYLRLGEQELRLEFTTAVRDLHPDRAGLVVIIDEAHLLHNRLLEELRTATHLVHDGEMLVRLILSGQLELEERLVKKDLAAINQRIVCHSTLSPLSRLESQEYLQQRIEWAGGTLEKIFEPGAVRMICQASDGNARCLNQLADHGLLLAAAGNVARVTAAHVVEALDELKQLPLHWNHVELPETAEAPRTEVVEIICGDQDETEEIAENESASHTACFEFGAADEVAEVENETERDFGTGEDTAERETAEDIELSWDAEDLDADVEMESSLPKPTAPPSEPTPEVSAWAKEPRDEIWFQEKHGFDEEELVTDHYAALDAGRLPELGFRQTRDWDTWDPVEELRAEEEALEMTLPPSILPEPPMIHGIPEAGEEWQPEDIILPRREPLSSDPSELIDRVLPLIEAALEVDPAEVPFHPIQEKTSEDSAPIVIADPSFEAILNEFSAQIGSNRSEAAEAELPLLFVDNAHLNAEEPGTSGEYVLRAGSEPAAAWEEEIAQTVLDTYSDIQPLLWDSMADAETEPIAQPLPRSTDEEPILDPGDRARYEELRQGLEAAVKAAGPASELIEEDSSPTEEPEQTEIQPAKIEYDIVLPESEEEEKPEPRDPIARTDAAERPYKYLFSKLRRNVSEVRED